MESRCRHDREPRLTVTDTNVGPNASTEPFVTVYIKQYPGGRFGPTG